MHKPAPVVGRVSTHSRPKAAGRGSLPVSQGSAVSTHSRPKAAGLTRATRCRACRSFNTQPPEGGWIKPPCLFYFADGFNTQPPEGGWGRIWRRGSCSAEFQHTAARRRLVWRVPTHSCICGFQHTAARRRLEGVKQSGPRGGSRFNTQPPEGGWVRCAIRLGNYGVSTHSRPKAAGKRDLDNLVHAMFQHTAARRRLDLYIPKAAFLVSFNTQPPEGGWAARARRAAGRRKRFNTQPPEGGWLTELPEHNVLFEFQHTAARRRLVVHGTMLFLLYSVSTHSRPKAAGRWWAACGTSGKFQHTAARRRLVVGTSGRTGCRAVSTHSRPKAAGFECHVFLSSSAVSTHSRPKAAGPFGQKAGFAVQFQHTAARRRLAALHKPAPVVGRVSTHSRPKAAGRGSLPVSQGSAVSTHSRPKAAGLTRATRCRACRSFNTQPPEGGWIKPPCLFYFADGFNTQPPEGGWGRSRQANRCRGSFNTQPPEGGWVKQISESKTPWQRFQHTAARRRLAAFG